MRGYLFKAKLAAAQGTGLALEQDGERAASPNRFHDVRAREIMAVSKISRSAAKGFARHQSASIMDL